MLLCVFTKNLGFSSPESLLTSFENTALIRRRRIHGATLCSRGLDIKVVSHVTGEERDQEILGKESWRKKCGQQDIILNIIVYGWRKMEAAAQDRAGWRQVICSLCSNWSDQA